MGALVAVWKETADHARDLSAWWGRIEGWRASCRMSVTAADMPPAIPTRRPLLYPLRRPMAGMASGSTPDELTDGIATILATKWPVLVNCQVTNLENCYPMIPAGAAHTEMLLGKAGEQRDVYMGNATLVCIMKT